MCARMRRPAPVTSSDGLIERAVGGDQRALSRLATMIENDADVVPQMLSRLDPMTGRAHVIGITGAPGVGKSSLLSGLAREVSKRQRRIAVIAIDPTSPRSGGATLGDRIRMTESALDPKVFVRSVASRERADGLAPAVADLALLFDAAGYDYVVIETVGSGQDQLAISDLVHTTVLVQIPGTGDSVQLMKAGAMEIADIYVINKADLTGAQRVARDLRSYLGLAAADASRWEPPIVLTSSVDNSGFSVLLDSMDRHLDYLRRTDGGQARRSRLARMELRHAIERRTKLDAPQHAELVDTLLEKIARRDLSPPEAAQRFLEAVAQE